MALLAPTVLILIGLVLYPFFYAIWLAFSDKTDGTPGQFVGFRNFAYVLAWPQFTTAVVNTIVFTVSAVALKFVLGMAVALVLNQGIRGRNFFRAFLLLPWAMPAFVVYLVWRWLYDPLSGLINYALIDLGLISTPIAFLSDRSTAMLSVIIAHVWRNFPFYAISFLAGMQTISQELYDAACTRRLMLAPANTEREVLGSRQLKARDYFVQLAPPHRRGEPLPFAPRFAAFPLASVGDRAPSLNEAPAGFAGHAGKLSSDNQDVVRFPSSVDERRATRESQGKTDNGQRRTIPPQHIIRPNC